MSPKRLAYLPTAGRFQRIALMIGAASLIVAACSTSHKSASKTIPSTPTTSGPSSPGSSNASPGSSNVSAGPVPSSGKTFQVTSYDGCRGDGSVNCGPALQAAVNAAQSAGGGTVYLPPGTYLDTSQAVHVQPGAAVTITGSNPSTTSIVEKSRKPTIFVVNANHVVIDNLTLDSTAVSNGGAVVLVNTSYNTVENSRILGGTNTAWPLRFAGGHGIATAEHLIFSTGNTVNNIYIEDDVPWADDGLDFPYQEDGSISNVRQYGSRLGLYIDKNVTVTNYSYTPNPALNQAGANGFYISAPSSDITITDFTSDGAGGIIGANHDGQSSLGNTNITINHEDVTGSGSLLVFGCSGLLIERSQLGTLNVSPRGTVQGTVEEFHISQAGREVDAGHSSRDIG